MIVSFSKIKWRVKQFAKKFFRISNEYEFIPAPSIQVQRMDVKIHREILTVEADYTTPLYETIAEIVDYDCYQLDKIKFSGSKDSVVIDIGANIGISALVFSCYHKGRILCFEPIEQNCATLERNAGINNRSRIEVIRKAVSKTNGMLTFSMEKGVSVSAHVLDQSNLDSHVLFDTVQVDSIDLRTVFATVKGKTVELIKLDCEGGEYDIVDQIDSTILEQINAITMEVHDLDDTYNLKRLESQFRQMNFRLYFKKEMFNRKNLHHLLALK